MKRARTSGGSLTGGTGDVKPQILTLSTGAAASASDYVVNQIALPVPRFGTMKTKATIIELLWVDWYLGLADLVDSANIKWGFLSTITGRADGDTATAASLEIDVADPTVFALAVSNKQFTTSGNGIEHYPIRINLTDMNGNGVLIATDRIFVVGADAAGTAGAAYVAKVAYRLTNVGITEYVGIVQSQQ